MRELVYRLPARLAHHARTRRLRFGRGHPHTEPHDPPAGTGARSDTR
jgi:hypothetical protein